MADNRFEKSQCGRFGIFEFRFWYFVLILIEPTFLGVVTTIHTLHVFREISWGIICWFWCGRECQSCFQQFSRVVFMFVYSKRPYSRSLWFSNWIFSFHFVFILTGIFSIIVIFFISFFPSTATGFHLSPVGRYFDPGQITSNKEFTCQYFSLIIE